MEKIALLTCTYNNRIYEEYMLKSLLKNSKLFSKLEIYIMVNDNNKDIPFPSFFNDYNIIDNRNFTFTKNYFEHSTNHCSQIDFALSNIIRQKKVILCDNDILFKSNIDDFINFSNNYSFVGEIGHDKLPNNRLFPYLCILDLDIMRCENIKYFDGRVISNGDDTGSSFLRELQKNNISIKSIKLNDYIIHYKNASLKNKDAFSFINKYKELY